MVVQKIGNGYTFPQRSAVHAGHPPGSDEQTSFHGYLVKDLMMVEMLSRRLLLALLVLGIQAAGVARPAEADEKPIRALLVIGGCCHDYAAQQKLLTEGISKRANVEWTISYDPDTGTNHLNPWYGKEDWSEGFDVVVHDECSANVKDIATVQKILKPHRDGLPAVVLHCGMHSYRTEGYPQTTPWFDFTGLASTGHGPKKPIDITFVSEQHPITQGLSNWRTEDEELYNNSNGRLLETAEPLATGFQKWSGKNGKENEANAVVAWTNRYNGGTRVFSTTLGHNNVTVGDDRYLDLVTRGLLWSVGRLEKTAAKPSADQ